MGKPFMTASLRLDSDGRFRLTYGNGTQRYPKIQILRNRIRVGCMTISKEAAARLLRQPDGFLQAESVESQP